MNNRFSSNNKSLSGKIPIYLIGLGIGIVTTILIMAVFAFTMTLVDFSETTISVMSVLSLMAGSFISSYYVGIKLKKGGLLLGVINGMIILLLIQLLSIFLNSFSLDMMLFIKIIFVLLSSLTGGICAVNKVAKRRI